MRVVPNLYPAFEHQEVVVHSPRHIRTLADLSDEEVDPIARAWHARLEAGREAGLDPYLFVNEGREAGASLPHSHSQLAWLGEPPAEVERELPRLAEGRCALCELLQSDPYEIAVDGELSLHAAPAGRVPYEMLIAPRAHAPRAAEAELGAALRLLRHAARRLHDVEGPVPLNTWLHEGAHWHFEVLPRLTELAGLELGAGVYVNWLLPEEAANRLRAVGG